MKQVSSQSNVRTSLPQLSVWKTLVLFLWPALWYCMLIFGVARPLAATKAVIPTWIFLLVIVLGTGAEMVVAILLLRHERRSCQSRSIALRDQIRFRWPRNAKVWIAAIVVFAVALALSVIAGPINRALAAIPGFTPPSWWPILSNPTVPVSSASDVFPDIVLPGNYGFFLLFALVGLVFNVIGEELYYRGYLLPRMRGVFGRFDWIANGLLFALKHVYQRWLYPGLAVAGLSFAFMAGPVGSLPLAMVSHWIGNYLMPLALLLKEVLK